MGNVQKSEMKSRTIQKIWEIGSATCKEILVREIKQHWLFNHTQSWTILEV